MTLESRRARLRTWLEAGLKAVEPEAVTAEALSGSGSVTVIAIGKAAAAMCRGAGRALGPISGVCVTNALSPVPDGVDLMLGDHPLPGARSLRAGRRVLEVAGTATGQLIALVSGGGSALCEQPLPGIDPDFLHHVNSVLLDSGASIDEINLVRRHLSAIKGGGVARAAKTHIDTYIISDVAGAGAEVVSSGPTITTDRDPELARETMQRYGIEVGSSVWEAMSASVVGKAAQGRVVVVADGRTAAKAVVEAAASDGVEARLYPEWLCGQVDQALDTLFTESARGFMVAAGETYLKVPRAGRGGRNTHAALLAAGMLESSDSIFASFATDGVDGRSEAAGAIVDGTTLDRGGDPADHLARFDSASYLGITGDLIRTGPTGTNVADIWALWRA